MMINITKEIEPPYKNNNKLIFIINGSGGVGKDTFVELVLSNNKNKNCFKIKNYSSVSKIKEIAKIIGWNGDKTEKDRKFLSDLKLLTTEYNDMPLNDIKKYVKDFMDCENSNNDNKILFLHIREPEEIAKAANEFKEYNVKTILVKRDSIKHITSNMADENVYNYEYDIEINNDGTIEDLREKAKCFINDCFINDLKKSY